MLYMIIERFKTREAATEVYARFAKRLLGAQASSPAAMALESPVSAVAGEDACAPRIAP
jgi:hypothetical protein